MGSLVGDDGLGRYLGLGPPLPPRGCGASIARLGGPGSVPPAPRDRTLRDLSALQRAVFATIDETMELIEQECLYDTGCGAVDAMLLASTLLTSDALLWTDDLKLRALAIRLDVAYSPARH